MAKSGLEFEFLVRSIYEQVLSQEDFNNIVVQHDVKKEGRSGQRHQVDLYWEFEVAHTVHKVAVECKEYKNSVSIGKIRDFYGVLEDLGNTSGVFVTTSNYQKGAITYARNKGIQLKVVETQNDDRIDTYTTNINMNNLYNVKANPKLDIDWLIDVAGIEEGTPIHIEAPTDQLLLLDLHGNRLDSFYDLECKLPRMSVSSENLKHSYQFTDTFLTWPNTSFPPLKIKSVDYTYDEIVNTTSSVSRFKVVAEKLLKDVMSDKLFLFNKTVEPLHEHNKQFKSDS
ncbi:restriction endonuclease [Aliivibrio wodanis]|uniref:restriction endonuclease n=1 Tax=Aliivibrio wodanis TaxID=80852 RepID=UPI00406D0FB9